MGVPTLKRGRDLERCSGPGARSAGPRAPVHSCVDDLVGTGCRQTAHPLIPPSPQPLQWEQAGGRAEARPSRGLLPVTAWLPGDSTLALPVRSCVRAGGAPRLSPAPSGEAAV